MSDNAVLLYVSVIKSECVTQLLINPIIRTRTRHISGMYHPTRHNIIMLKFVLSNSHIITIWLKLTNISTKLV
jgi:hypothetical protein